MNSKSKWMLTGVSSVLALTLLIPTANADTLSELQQEQQKVEQKQNELNSGISEKSNEMNQNQSTLESIMAKIQELENQMQETQSKINGVQGEIDQTIVEIEELQKSIEELERKIAERTELLQERARAIQLSGGSVDYIDVLLGANSFVDFIDRFSAVNTLIDADREIMTEQAEDKKLLGEQKALVETKLAEQEERRAELVNLKESLEGQKAQQAGLVKDLKAEQERLAKEKTSLVQQRDEAIDISADLETKIVNEQARLAELARKAEEERQRKLAAERAAAEKAAAEKAAAERAAAERAAAERAAAEKAASKSQAAKAPAAVSAPASTPAPAYSAPEPAVSVSASSGFIRPAAGRFTSKFGWRDIGSGPEFHQGVDIANSKGTTIVAAANGFVSYAGSMGGYGNVVIITHSINGQTHATVYAHLNSISVSVGQQVSQGQKVGGMGNTGRSFGDHLHFEIHVGPWNGGRTNAVNPASYISL
ncbi:peptidoglycan DD-metalloendopeptidase family protein [Microbacterium sp. APC 3898]|uniref:Peptidoglycan DD-metalloendopeptidase family protein n=1 Tax=Planococcus notacanthi TaxID=3035188 RepID=A0ABT7ZFH6_9BACL|nr:MULTISPECIES: M23 family metallopeptidase [Terrabacteria group]MDN3425909.1 peptidoglycan DD-metalloendopeptidase family protein [Planococcus sp. APC 4016]MDN3497606.1 peptidoglycan DD-metalloendopeptidase family protein [Microbacterium sp. APC 3898]